MEDTKILKELYSREESLFNQLTATQNAIIGFAGTPKVPHKVQLANLHGTIEKTPEVKEPVKVVAPTESKRNDRSEVYNYIVEILKEANMPFKTGMITSRLSQLGFDYRPAVVSQYLGFLVKDSRIIKVDHGRYTHNGYKHPVALKKEIITIYEVKDYIKLRGEVTRKELMSHFVKGGRMNENMMQLRLTNLLEDDLVIRKERGVYAWKKFRE